MKPFDKDGTWRDGDVVETLAKEVGKRLGSPDTVLTNFLNFRNSGSNHSQG